MWIEQLANGKYKYIDRYTDSSGKSHRVSVTLDKKSKQAERIARDMLRAKIEVLKKEEDPTTPDPTILTFAELCELYLDDQKTILKVSTWSRNKGALNSIKKILGENIACEDLSAGYIRKRFLDTGKAPVTLNEYIARLKALLRWAYKNDYVEDIRYLDKLDKFKDVSRREKVQYKFLESSEVAALLESMHIQLWQDLTQFLVLSGLRFGEAAALTRKDVDISTRTIHVTKNYDYRHDLTTDPKNHSSIREVYMQDELYNLCRLILGRNNIVTISNLFFVQKEEHISYYAYRKYLETRCKEVLGRVISPHALRHTHASLMLEAGMDVDSIAARLGHSTTKITREIYLHVTEKLKEQRNDAIKSIRIIG